MINRKWSALSGGADSKKTGGIFS